MTLSDKMWDESGQGDWLAFGEDIKQFIKDLKEFNMKVGQHSKGDWQKKIIQLAGEKLI